MPRKSSASQPPTEHSENLSPADKEKAPAETAERSPPPPVIVVGVGASAGGLEALRGLLSALPSDTGAAYVLIPHLDPHHQSLMADLLGKRSSIEVQEIRSGLVLRPNTAYVIPPGKYVSLSGNQLRLRDSPSREGLRMAIDFFFSSLAAARPDRAVGIVLSGTGSDGSLGVEDIKAAGGLTMAQTPETAAYDAMPRNAIATRCIDHVLDIPEMPRALQNFFLHPSLPADGGPDSPELDPAYFERILALLEEHTEYDFRSYKKGTLHRRLQRRMSLRQTATLKDYYQLLLNEEREVQALFEDLLISVTSFFREPEAWRFLEEKIAAPLIKRKGTGESLRVWVPGCATGEEAYSTGMIFLQQMERLQKRVDLNIFATDIDEQAIATARAGYYSLASVSTVSPPRLHRYFRQADERYRVVKRLRACTVFAVQNVIADPPFSKLDFISCRNVMIYLEAETQMRLLELFHFALNPDGVLFLGNSETAAKLADLFEPISKEWRIYRKRGATRRSAFRVSRRLSSDPPGTLHESSPPHSRHLMQANRLGDLAREALLRRFAPPAVVIDRDHRVHHFQGTVRDFLDFPHGEPTDDLFKMLLPGMGTKLRQLLQRAWETGERHTELARRVQSPRGRLEIAMSAEPLGSANAYRDPRENLLLVTFQHPEAPAALEELATSQAKAGDPAISSKKPGARSATSENQALRKLREELEAVRDDLQNTIEDLETSNEELTASNEQVMSMNEELQFANEELETSREELQSLNEELSTVNSQLEEKVRELEDTNNDVTNLLYSTEIATLFLDNDLRIRRFTPSLSQILRVISSDVGRPIADLASDVHDPELLDDIRKVRERLAPVSRQVNTEDRVFTREIQPYRTADHRLHGVVLTYTDITKLHLTSEKLRARERQQAAIAKLGKEALKGKGLQSILDLAVHLLSTTLRCEMAKVLEYVPGENHFFLAAGVGWKPGLVGHAAIEGGLDSQAGFTFQCAGPVIVENLKEEKRFHGPPLLHEHHVVSGMSVPIVPTASRTWGVLGVHTPQERLFTIDDINFLQSMANTLATVIERERHEDRLLESESQMRILTDALPVMIAYVDRDQRYRFVNAYYQRAFDRPKGSIIGMTVEELTGTQIYSQIIPHIRAALEGRPQSFEFTGNVARLGHRLLQISYVPDPSPEGTIQGFYAIIMDVTQQRETEERVGSLLEHTSSGFIGLDAQGHCTYLNRAAQSLLGQNREDILRRPLLESCPQMDTPILRQALSACLTERQPTTAERCLIKGRYLDFQFSPVGESVFASIIDVTDRVEGEKALRKSEERFRLAERGFHGFVYEWKPDQNFAWRSVGMEAVLGIKPDQGDPTGDWWLQRIHDEDRQRVSQAFDGAVSNNQENYDVRYRVRHADGSWVSVWDRGFIVRDPRGDEELTIYGNVVNVTEHVEAQLKLQELNDHLEERVRERTAELSASAEALEQRSHELAILAENVPAIFAYISREGTFRFANKSFEELYRRSQNEILDLPLEQVMGSAGVRLLEDVIERTLAGETVTYERQIDIPRDGCRWLSAIHLPRRNKDDDIEGFFFLAQDITERKSLETELVTIAEEERAAFSRELHDGLGSFLSGLGFRIQALKKDVNEGSMPQGTEVAYLGELLSKAIEQTRELARGWQPVEDKPTGLMEALEQLTETMGRVNGSECLYACPKPVLIKDPLVANHLYRIAQEAITNAVKHSGASLIEVRLLRQESGVTLVVEDNGSGLPDVVSQGLGCRTMRHRANVIGAELLTGRGSDSGTKVECRLRLHTPASQSQRP